MRSHFVDEKKRRLQEFCAFLQIHGMWQVRAGMGTACCPGMALGSSLERLWVTGFSIHTPRGRRTMVPAATSIPHQLWETVSHQPHEQRQSRRQTSVTTERHNSALAPAIQSQVQATDHSAGVNTVWLLMWSLCQLDLRPVCSSNCHKALCKGRGHVCMSAVLKLASRDVLETELPRGICP